MTKIDRTAKERSKRFRDRQNQKKANALAAVSPAAAPAPTEPSPVSAATQLAAPEPSASIVAETVPAAASSSSAEPLPLPLPTRKEHGPLPGAIVPFAPAGQPPVGPKCLACSSSTEKCSVCGGTMFEPWDKDSAMVPAMLAAETIGRLSVAGLGLSESQTLRYGRPSGEEVMAIRDAAIPYLNQRWPGTARYSAELRMLGVVTKMVMKRRAAVERELAATPAKIVVDRDDDSDLAQQIRAAAGEVEAEP